MPKVPVVTRCLFITCRESEEPGFGTERRGTAQAPSQQAAPGPGAALLRSGNRTALLTHRGLPSLVGKPHELAFCFLVLWFILFHFGCFAQPAEPSRRRVLGGHVGFVPWTCSCPCPHVRHAPGAPGDQNQQWLSEGSVSMSGKICQHGVFVVLAARGGAASTDRWVNSWHWDELVGLVVACVLNLLPPGEAGGAGAGGAEASKGAEVLGAPLLGSILCLASLEEFAKLSLAVTAGDTGGWDSPRASAGSCRSHSGAAADVPPRAHSCVCPSSSAEPQGGIGQAVGPVSRKAAGKGAESDTG